MQSGKDKGHWWWLHGVWGWLLGSVSRWSLMSAGVKAGLGCPLPDAWMVVPTQHSGCTCHACATAPFVSVLQKQHAPLAATGTSLLVHVA